MKRLAAMAFVPVVVGCSSMGSHATARNAADAATAAAQDELTALRVELEEREQELRTVRGQLALARAEVQELKGRADRRRAEPSTLSGNADLPWTQADADLGSSPQEIRIDGRVVDERLATTSSVPDLPAFEEPEVPPEPSRPEVDVEGYRRALRLVREQRFDEALTELQAFVEAYPGHPYADNALYWCGEIHYLRREYGRALEYFKRVEKLHPFGNKAPDALYRAGQIYMRRGDTARARAYFDKVREQFPDTAAARLALREDAS